MLKLYFKLAIFIIFSALVFGFAGPWLISYDDSFLVATGFLLIIFGWFPLFIWVMVKWVKQLMQKGGLLDV